MVFVMVQAITEELNSQREMMLTQQHYQDDPLWRRPDPPTAPPSLSPSSRTHLSPRPRSASATSTAHSSSHTQSKLRASAAGGTRTTESADTDAPPALRPPLESPALTRHKQEVKWHRGPVMGGSTQRARDQVSNKSTVPILQVTMANMEARAKEIDEFSSGDDIDDDDDDIDDDDDDSSEEEEDRGGDRDRFAAVGGLKAQRPNSAPASASVRSIRTKKLQGKEEERSVKKNIRFGNDKKVGRHDGEESKQQQSEGATAALESSSSDDEDDYEEEEENEAEGGKATNTKKKRVEVLRQHKRHALMGPRALVAADNDEVTLHKTQLAMEIDEFVDLYGQDVFTVDYSGGGRDVIESKRVAFTVISNYLLANNKEEELNAMKGKKGKKGSKEKKVVAGDVAKDTLGIMNLFMKDMKQRHDKVQMHNKVSEQGVVGEGIF